MSGENKISEAKNEVTLKEVIEWRKDTYGGGIYYIDFLINEVKSMRCEECDGQNTYTDKDEFGPVIKVCPSCQGSGRKWRL